MEAPVLSFLFSTHLSTLSRPDPRIPSILLSRALKARAKGVGVNLVWLQIVIGLSVIWLVILGLASVMLLVGRFLLRRRLALYFRFATVVKLITLCFLLGITYQAYEELLSITAWLSDPSGR